MAVTSILGMFGTMFGLIRALPQLVRLLRTKEAFGVSVDTAATSAICSFGWVVYGIWTSQFFFSLASSLTGLTFALITLYALRRGRRVKEFKVAPLWFTVLMLATTSGLIVALKLTRQAKMQRQRSLP